jgi:hypothetical protein
MLRKNVFLLMGLSLFVAPVLHAADLEGFRANIRASIMERAFEDPSAEAPRVGDQAKDLVDVYKSTNLRDMEQKGLKSASLAESPWSDFYWPTYAGGIANRYGDRNYNAALVWKDNERYLMKMLGRGNPNELSPAEKYDLLVGDSFFTMARRAAQGGAPYADEKGEVETWFGICHGWAPASFMLPRPAKAVKVLAADGREIVFTPSDIKALGSQLWANAGVRTRFVGGRCEEKEPKRDEKNREINPTCLDSNPATWHMAIVNQIGIAKRSFVMDAQNNYEVWNHPVFSYIYAYKNPSTGKDAATLEEAKAAVGSYEDSYAKFRAPNAKYVVRVVMSVDYVSESQPSEALEDNSGFDVHVNKNLVYDLELDEQDNIVGGEWQSYTHPDFLWVPMLGQKPKTEGDFWVERGGESWNGSSPLPNTWREAARVSSRRDAPLAYVVEKLFELSK